MTILTFEGFEAFNQHDDQDNQNVTYEFFFKELIDILYLWHDEIFLQISQNEYLENLEELNIKINICTNLVISMFFYQELICEDTGILYIKESEAKYALIDIYTLISQLINNQLINNSAKKSEIYSKKELILFSILLFKTLNSNNSVVLNMNQITNRIHPILSMIFYNELQKQIKDLGLTNDNLQIKTKFVINNFSLLLKRKISERFDIR